MIHTFMSVAMRAFIHHVVLFASTLYEVASFLQRSKQASHVRQK